MLEGMKVVEVASIAAGPMAGAMLAEWGADVIKIEPLDGDPARHIPAGLGITDIAFDPDLDLHNRGKRSIALDLSKPAAREIVDRLVADADIFITNMLSDKQAERGLDWARLNAINPRLIHASISGYGATGPDSQLRAIDHTAFWARSGMVHLMTPKGGDPVPIRRAMGDRMAGTALVAGILAAYVEASRTGRGKIVETSLLRTAIFTIGTDLVMQTTRGRVGSSQSRQANINPFHSFFPTADGRWIAASLGRIESLGILGDPDFLIDPRFASASSRRSHGPELVARLDEIFRRHTLAEWTEKLQHAAFSWAPVQRPEEVVVDEQAMAAGALVDVPLRSGGSYRAPAMPVGFLDSDGIVDGLPVGQAPVLGEHGRELLAGLGYDEARIDALVGDHVMI